MQHLFLPFEESKQLALLGYDEGAIARYSKGQFQMNFLGKWYKHNSGEIERHYIAAPLYDQAFEWFRNKNMNVEVVYDYYKHLSYDEAKLETIRKLIETLKNEKSISNSGTSSSK